MTGAEQPITGDTNPVAAYCAPGLRSYAAMLLALWHEEVREIIETPLMAGTTDVMLVVDRPLSGWPPPPGVTDPRD